MRAAKRCFHKMLKRCQYVPWVVITDQLKREVLPRVEHWQHRYGNHRAENSHRPTCQRERRMQGSKSPGLAQCFLATYGPIAHHFRPRRHRFPAPEYRQETGNRFQTWQELTTLPTAA